LPAAVAGADNDYRPRLATGIATVARQCLDRFHDHGDKDVSSVPRLDENQEPLVRGALLVWILPRPLVGFRTDIHLWSSPFPGMVAAGLLVDGIGDRLAKRLPMDNPVPIHAESTKIERQGVWVRLIQQSARDSRCAKAIGGRTHLFSGIPGTLRISPGKNS